MISEVLTASIIRSLIALMMEVVSTSETSLKFYQTSRHGATTQKTAIFMLVAVRT
jgi:hypothetical protein